MPRRPEIRRFETPTCAGVLAGLEAYVDGDLEVAEAAAIAAHLEACPACTAEHHLAAAVRRELRSLPELDAPPALLREITRQTPRVARQGEARTRRRRGFTLAPMPAWARLAAAVVATAVLGASLWWGALRQLAPVEPSLDREGELLAVDPEAVARATEEARYALAYLAKVHRRAGLKLRDDLFIERVARPSVRSLARSLAHGFGKETTATVRCPTCVLPGQDRDRS